jgi:hypothetical protein
VGDSASPKAVLGGLRLTRGLQHRSLQPSVFLLAIRSALLWARSGCVHRRERRAVLSFRYRAVDVRAITQGEAERMCETRSAIASFYNPAAEFDGGQAAARGARATFEEIGLAVGEDTHVGEPRGGA